MLSALAVWRPRVMVTHIDLSDGETLQWSGVTSPRRLRRLRATVSSDSAEVLAPAERVGGTDSAPGFHVMVDLRPLLDARSDLTGTLAVGRRRARIAWSTTAFDNPNLDEVRQVAPDLDRLVQRSLRRESAGVGVRITCSDLSPRLSVTTTHLAETCRLRVESPTGTTIESVEWRLDDLAIGAKACGDNWWEWADLSALARPGARWALTATGSEGESPVHLPHSDLRHAGAARVFPLVDIGPSLALALGADGGNRIVLRCRATDHGGHTS